MVPAESPPVDLTTDERVRAATVLAACAVGHRSTAAAAMRAALTDGALGCAALREALLMLAPFAGVPRCLDALTVFGTTVRELGVDADPRIEDDLPTDAGARTRLFADRGRVLFGRVYGEDTERVLAGLRRLDPELPDWVLEGAYGRVLARPGLTTADRECLAVVVLTALDLPRQLRGHLLGALRCDVPPDDLRACLEAARPSLPAERLQDALDQLDVTSA